MKISVPIIIISLLVYIIIGAAVIFLFVTLIRALLKYINSSDVRNEKKLVRNSLGEVLKIHRTNLKMTQEFVAESLGVSRQAVSKWENGTADPSTSNLISLAKLHEIDPEELIKSVTKEDDK